MSIKQYPDLHILGRCLNFISQNSHTAIQECTALFRTTNALPVYYMCIYSQHQTNRNVLFTTLLGMLLDIYTNMGEEVGECAVFALTFLTSVWFIDYILWQ